MRLINADELTEIIKGLIVTVGGKQEGIYFKDSVLKVVDEQPTIEAEPVRHGRWEFVGNVYEIDECKCSSCDYVVSIDDYFGDELSPYCPQCGAKMEEEE